MQDESLYDVQDAMEVVLILLCLVGFVAHRIGLSLTTTAHLGAIMFEAGMNYDYSPYDTPTMLHS